ncbi:MAG: TonB-dependent receptor plug domain-containing protein, partial [Candidatus Poribacteria bacterium]
GVEAASEKTVAKAPDEEEAPSVAEPVLPHEPVAEVERALPPVSQAAAEEAEVKRPKEGIEVMVIEARRRQENLQEVPHSIIAFNRKQLEELDINSYNRLGEFAPNLQFMSQPVGRSGGIVQIGIRGRVQNDSLNTLSNSVGFYVDDIFYGKQTGFPLEFIDVERIEVLRGPQGTLYGKNTPAGAIRVTTRKPTGDWGFETDLNVGRFSYVQTRSTLNFPVFGGEGVQIGDGSTDFGTLSGKVTFLHAARDGVFGNSNVNNPATMFPSPGTAGISAAAAAARIAADSLYNDGLFAKSSSGFLEMDRLSGLVNVLY